ncbi:MAG: hypothetical protein ACTSRS_07625 [Candidatus Helarchaeota archaeon]
MKNRISKQQWLGIALIVIALPLAIYVVFFGAFFQPEAPPSQWAHGYAQLSVRDGMTGDPITGISADLIFAGNMTYFKTVPTDTPFYVATGTLDGCLYYIEIPGYYPVSGTLLCSGDDSETNVRVNTVNAFKRANYTAVEVHLLRWQNLTNLANNYSGNLPTVDGDYKFWIQISISEQERYSSLFGVSTWVPEYALPPGSLAATMNLTFQSLWFGWNADVVTDYYVLSSSWPYDEVYPIEATTMKCTIQPTCWYETTYVVEGHFEGLTQLRIFDGFIDNYSTPTAIIT